MNILIKLWNWFEDRTGLVKAISPILKHPIPPGTGWKYVFGSGTLICLIIQIVSGTALATIYNSSPDGAYQSLQFITNRAAFGSFLRGLHWFGASGMFILIAAHWTRVYLTGSYKFPREMQWITGIFLAGCVVVMGYTGQLLRWDQNGVWSTVIAAEQAGRVPWIGVWLGRFILGGDTVNGVTLSRYFAIHIFFVPVLIFALLGLHLYLVIRNGISEPAKPGHPVDPKTYRAWYERLLKRSGEPFFPDAMWRDVVFGTLVVIAIALLAWLVGPPALSKPPDATIVPAEPRPDWYLLWYYAILAVLPSYMEKYMIVGAPLAAFLFLFFMPILWNKGERSVRRRPWTIFTVICVYFLIFWFWKVGKVAAWSPRFESRPLTAAAVGATTGPVADGGKLFFSRGCEQCHTFAGQGGIRGPDLTHVADKYTANEITYHILAGGENMPAYGGILSSQEVHSLVAFLEAHKTLPFGPPNAGRQQ